MRVAVIGASATRSKYGNKALRSYAAAGHEVFAVNPHEHEVEGFPVFASAKDIPGPLDRALLYVPPQVGINVLEDLAQAGVGEVYVNPGAGSPELLTRGKQLGLTMIEDCAIIAIGDSPVRY